MSGLSSLRIAADGCELKVLRAGTGPVLLIMHGGEQDADAYEALVRELSPRFCVVVYDRRGYAGSPSTQIAAGDRFIDQQVDDALLLLEQAGIERAVVLGSSSGAIIALRLALRAPDRLRGLILHEPAWIEPFPVVADAFRQLIASGGRAGGAGSDRYKPANSEYWRRCEVEPVLTHRFLAAELATLRLPTVVALGRTSSPQMQAIAAWASWRLSVPLLEFPGGHEPVFEAAPAEFGAAIRSAVERVDEIAQRAPAGNPGAR